MVAAGRGEVDVITGGFGRFMVSENDAGPAVPSVLVAVTANVKVPFTVGMPLSRPIVDNMMPAGNVPLDNDQDIGCDPLAVN
jgi:hypothetical protein